MKKIKNFFIQLLILAIKTIYREKIEQFFHEIGEKTQWQLFSGPVLIPVKKGKRKYYLFEYMDCDGKHTAYISRHEFKRSGERFPVDIKTESVDDMVGDPDKPAGPIGNTGHHYGIIGGLDQDNSLLHALVNNEIPVVV